MNYNELMDFLNIECQATINDIIVNDFFNTTQGRKRVVMYDFPKTIGKNIKTFNENGMPIKIDISKPKSEMCFTEYVKLLCKAKISFDIDFEENYIDGKTVVVAHDCECGCVSLPVIKEFKRYELTPIA